MDAGNQVVGDVYRNIGLACHVQRLVHRIEKLVAEMVTHVGVVDPAVCRYGFADGDEFLQRAKDVRVVREAGSKTHAALLHGLRSQTRHLPEVILRGGAIFPADDGQPQRVVRYLVGDVNGYLPVEAVHVFGNGLPKLHVLRQTAVDGAVELRGLAQVFWRHRRVAKTVGAEDLGGDALRDLGSMVRFAQQDQVGVIVDVNKAGANHFALGVNFGLRLAGGQPAHCGNAALSNPHIGAKPRVAQTVYHTAVANDEVEGHVLLVPCD